MKNNLDLLDEIILSSDVVTNFHYFYENNKEFRDWINETIPEIEKCSKQAQNNPWHKYNVLDHILHSIAAMNNLTKNKPLNEKRLLAYTMLFHDIGKPATHITREKKGVIIDSFFNHNKKGVEIAKPILSKLNFSQDEQNIILAFIDKHDIFMFITLDKTNNPYHKMLDKKLIDNEINDLNKYGDGIKLLNWLLLVGRSDNLAQNEKLTEKPLEMLDKFQSMLNSKKR